MSNKVKLIMENWKRFLKENLDKIFKKVLQLGKLSKNQREKKRAIRLELQKMTGFMYKVFPL